MGLFLLSRIVDWWVHEHCGYVPAFFCGNIRNILRYCHWNIERFLYHYEQLKQVSGNLYLDLGLVSHV